MSVDSIGNHNAGLIAQSALRPKKASDAAATGPRADLPLPSDQDAAAALQGQIRVAREQLNDWVTCVSATTPKGQAEIRSLSAQISAAQEHISRLQKSSSGAHANATASGSVLDVWA